MRCPVLPLRALLRAAFPRYPLSYSCAGTSPHKVSPLLPAYHIYPVAEGRGWAASGQAGGCGVGHRAAMNALHSTPLRRRTCARDCKCSRAKSRPTPRHRHCGRNFGRRRRGPPGQRRRQGRWRKFGSAYHGAPAGKGLEPGDRGSGVKPRPRSARTRWRWGMGTQNRSHAWF